MAKTSRLKKNGLRKTRKGHSSSLVKSLYPKAYGGGTTPDWSPLFGTYIVISLAGSEETVPLKLEQDRPGGWGPGGVCKSTGRGEYGTGREGTFINPYFICVDSVNPPNIYVQEFPVPGTGLVNAIVKVTQNATGTLGTTSAFLNTQGGPVDSGTLSSASTGRPLLIAMNKSNDVIYLAEWSHHQIRRINTGAGRSGSSGFSGVDTVYTPGSINNGAKRVDGREGLACMNHPYMLCVSPDGKRMYVWDEQGSTIRMIDILNSINAPKELYFSSLCSLPNNYNVHGAVVDTSGNLFYTLVGSGYGDGQTQQMDIRKVQNHAIYKVNKVPDGTQSPSGVQNNPDLAVPTIFAGSATEKGYVDDPVGTTARFNRPMGIACDSNNNIYVADTYNNRIRVITPAGRVYTLAGNGPEISPESSTLLTTRANKGDG